MQITISEDLMSAVVGPDTLKVGGPITFKNMAGKWIPGTILEFRYVDKKGLNAPWCFAKDLKSNEILWFSLELWSRRDVAPTISKETIAAAMEVLDAMPTPAPVESVNNEISDDDFL